MRVRLRSSTWSVTLVPWYEAAPATPSGPVYVTAARLRLLIHEQLGAASALRGLLHDLGELAFGIEHLSDEALAEQVAALIERGRIRVELELREPAISTPVERSELPEHTSEPTAMVEDDHWIEVQLLDEDGAGVAGERCRITLSDGRQLIRTTDRHGLVRIERIPAGTCAIAFLDLDSEAFEPVGA